MAVTVSFDLTDEQWEFAQEYFLFVHPETKLSVKPTTVEELSAALYAYLKRYINREIQGQRMNAQNETDDF